VQLSSLGNLSPGSIASDLRADPRHAVLAAKQALIGDTERTRLFFAVDQFEEIFTLCRDEDERSCFIEALLELASEERCPAVVVIGMRADFYGRCATYPRLASTLQDHQGLIGPMGLRELREAIELPAAAAGLVLEPGLVDEILADIADEPGALPLLQHALLETWKRRDGRRLTLRGYQEAGTIREAIARTAEGMFETLPEDQQAIVKSVFLRLTEPGEGTEDTRRRVQRSELGSGRAEIAEVLDTLASERLVTLGPDTVEVAHEALIREWPRLRRWLDEDREGLRIHRRLTEDARTWEDLDRDPGALYRGARLQAASEWAERHPGDLNPLEQSFLETSRSTEQSEVEAVRTRNRRLRLLAAGLGVLLAIALASAGFALLATRRAEREAAGATSAALASDALETLDNQVDVALLLALEAFRRDDTPQARSALLAGVQRTVGLDRLFSADAGVYALAYSPDGRTIASAGLDGSIEFWDSRTGRRRGAPLKAHGKDVLDLAFSPDGRVLASGSQDKTVRLWDVGTRRRVGVLKSHSGTVYSVVFSPDGRWLASAGGDGNVALWDVRAKRRLDQIHVGEKSYDVTFNPKRNELAAGTSANTVRLIDVKRGVRRRAKLSLGRELGEQDEDYSLLDVTYSQNGRRLATASGDTTIEIWDPRNGEHIKTLGVETGHSDSIQSVAFSRDGRLLASGGSDRAVFLWDVDLGEELGEPLRVNGNWVESVVFSPDGRSLAVGGLDGTISLWDPEEHERAGVRHRLHTDDVNDLTFSRDGKVLATAGDDDVVRLWADHGTRALRPALRGHTDIVWAVDFSPDDKLVAGAGADGTVRLWPTSRKSPRGVALAHGKKGVRAVSFAPKGHLLATGGEEGTIKFWDSKTRKQNGKALRAYPGGTVYDLDFSPDGRLLASVGESSSVTLWDVEKRRKVAELEGHTDTIEEVEFSPDGSTLASGSTNNVILFWDVARREPISRPLAEHDNSIRALAFSPDGHTLASGSADETIIFWDVESHRRLGLPLKSHQDEVSAVAFDPTGRFLAASSYDSTYSLWSREFWTHDRKTLEASVCDKVARSLTRVEWEEFLPDEPYRRTCGG
jgi:WD40 repeat protein